MAQRIWKFVILLDNLSADRVEIAMPAGATLLSAGNQRGELCVWALVDPEAPRAPRTIHVAGTGFDLDVAPGRFLGTVQFGGGALVLHVFDAGEGGSAG